jgi:hypothetical protein
MSHMFGSEYDELVARARLGSAYDNQLSDIAEERLALPSRSRTFRKRGKESNRDGEFEAQLLEDAIFLPERKM